MTKQEIKQKLGIVNLNILDSIINRFIQAIINDENKEFTIKIYNKEIKDTIRETFINKVDKSEISFIK